MDTTRGLRFTLQRLRILYITKYLYLCTPNASYDPYLNGDLTIRQVADALRFRLLGDGREECKDHYIASAVTVHFRVFFI
jgi:hypothetical protein